MKLVNIFFFIVLSIWSLVSLGQPTESLSTKSKKAIKLFQEAKQQYSYKYFDDAQENALKAIDIDEDFLEAYILMGYIAQEEKNFRRARKYFKKATEFNSPKYPEIFLVSGNLEFREGNYIDAKTKYERFLDFKGISKPSRMMASRKLVNCNFGINAMKNPVEFNPVNMGPNVNSRYPEYLPCLTADENTILFTRRIKDTNNPRRVQEDFYVSERKNGSWLQAYNLGKPTNTMFNEGAPTMSADGNILIFTVCEAMGNTYGPGRKGYGSCDLFISSKTGNKWTNPQNIGRPVNSYDWETQPSFSSDGKTVYFIRASRKKGSSRGDIYMTRQESNGSWMEPQKLPKNINTPYDESSVFIHSDNETLYFSSEGHPGMGGKDIYLSRKDSNGNWGKPVNLGYPINTNMDESSLMISADGTKAFFASDREGGHGSLDLYWFELPKHLRPKKVTYFKGTVVDSKTKKPLEADFKLVDLKSGKEIAKSKSNPGNGKFLVCLPENREYALDVAKKGYLFYSENFMLKTEGKSGELLQFYEKNISLEPIIKDEETKAVVLKNVFFKVDSYELSDKSRIELERLVRFLNENPDVKIEISGHTDNTGNEKNNKILSENRAKAVYLFLTKLGVDSKRVAYVGHGASKPIASNDSDEGKAANRRTEYKVIKN